MYNKRKINKILIVDDSAMNRGILADMLEGQYETLEAEDGIEAVKMLYTHRTEIWMQPKFPESARQLLFMTLERFPFQKKY